MTSDPHFEKIIEKLNHKLNPDTFEFCAVDLIRKSGFPTAVPIRGGNDAGMDGAVADGEGEPFPIIVTTAKNVSRNMKTSLDRYVEEQGQRRRCIVVTNQSLTPARQRNLRDRAREKGFMLTHLLEQAGLALLLCREPRWCKELLGVTGAPSALSVIPITSRPLAIGDLVGREDSREWLRNAVGDRLLVGEPGAGKTSLLHDLAMDVENRALFLVGDDEREIANAIREQQPQVIIVDDAHVDVGLLRRMQRLRKDVGAEFELLASCWNGDRPDIEQLLAIPPGNVHELKRMTQDEIVEIVNSAGIIGNNWLIDEIVSQAAGLPGLAGTLAYFALQGRWREVYTGEALATDITRFYRNRINANVAGLLACFALGGNAGMGKETVSETLDLPILQLQQDLSNLEPGGIIGELPNSKDYIRVRPSALRHALIRDVFFSGARSLPETCLQELLAAAPEDVETVRELIDVTRRWGNVPPSLIQNPLKRFIAEIAHWTNILPSSPLGYSTPTIEAVREYAWLGPEEANWVIDNFTSSLSHVARPLLQHVPERIIPYLLAEAIGDTRPLNSNTEHPLEHLEDWIKQARPGTVEPTKRRHIVLSASRTWLYKACPVLGHNTSMQIERRC